MLGSEVGHDSGSYASVARLFQNFGVQTSSAAISRYYNQWAVINKSKIQKQAGALGLPDELAGELNMLFLPDALREEMGPSIKTSILCGLEEDVITVGSTVADKLGAVQNAIEVATAELEEAPGGEANLGYVGLLYDTAIEAGGNSVLDNYIGFVWAVRQTNDYFVDVVADQIGRTLALRGIGTLVDEDFDLDGFKGFANELLRECFYAGRITTKKCIKDFQRASLAFVDGKINIEQVMGHVKARVSHHMGFFFDRAAHDKKAHLLALDPHRMEALNALAGFDVSTKRAAIAEAMATI